MKKNLRVKIPQELKDIKLKTLMEWFKIAPKETVTFFHKQKCTSIFLNVPLNIVDTFPKKEVDKIYDTIFKILNDKEVKEQRRFKFNGQEFGMIPNFEKMTSGEFMDLSTYIGDWSKMNKAAACLFRPITISKFNKSLKVEQYLIEEYKGSSTYEVEMLNISADKMLGAIFFLTRSFKLLSKDTTAYILKQLKSDKSMMSKLSENVGDGTPVSMEQLEESLLTLNKSLEVMF